ncbi:10060_t:CDS:2 [Paraglomus occultum]|uniref:10060_t:CDS:1 n=1 Tax=Paraglomus occultum TaxID=144539 RepID=A0A9N9A2G5_9GLOM|nr:10060_t:CDS:2 [Paraglomus occultum]
MEDRRPIEPLLVRLIAELRKPIHESSVDPSMFIVHAGLWSSNRKEERSLVINPSSIPTQSTGLSSTVMSLNGPTCTMGLGHHQTYQKDDVTSLASCAAYTKRGLERLKVLKEKSEELAPIRDALDFSSGLLPPSPAVDSTDQFAHSNVQEQRSTPNSEAVLLPNFESVSYDRVQDLYEQRKGTLYFIPEGFEPVLVPNDTKAQTVTNLLETAKQVSAPLNVPRMLPDADVPLPTPLRYSRSLKPNAFFFYRRAKLPALRNAGMKCSEALAKISCMWREETPEVRLMFEKMAEDARQEHMKGYPEYPYKGYSEYPYKGYSEYPYKWYSEYPYKGYSEYQFRRTLVAKNTGITKLEHTLQQIDAEHSSRPNKPYTVAETRLNPSSSNILIHNGTAKITDFGLSTMLVQLLSESRGEGTAAYRDPVSFRDPSYRRKKESDVFSLGVMLWEISSGKVPCEGCKSHEVPKYREKGFRDPPSFETPETYVRLYEKCWEEDPYKRPICKEVYRQLRNMYEIQICQNQNMAIEALDLSYEHMNIGDRPLMPALESSSSIAALPNYCSA